MRVYLPPGAVRPSLSFEGSGRDGHATRPAQSRYDQKLIQRSQRRDQASGGGEQT